MTTSSQGAIALPALSAVHVLARDDLYSVVATQMCASRSEALVVALAHAVLAHF